MFYFYTHCYPIRWWNSLPEETVHSPNLHSFTFNYFSISSFAFILKINDYLLLSAPGIQAMPLPVASYYITHIKHLITNKFYWYAHVYRQYITISGLEISAVKQISMQGPKRIYGA